jgi:hypothetical protein
VYLLLCYISLVSHWALPPGFFFEGKGQPKKSVCKLRFGPIETVFRDRFVLIPLKNIVVFVFSALYSPFLSVLIFFF